MSTEIVYLNVEGMNCEHCARAVADALKGVPGVSRAEVTLHNRTATVVFDNASASVEALCSAVEKQGFAAEMATH